MNITAHRFPAGDFENARLVKLHPFHAEPRLLEVHALDGYDLDVGDYVEFPIGPSEARAQLMYRVADEWFEDGWCWTLALDRDMSVGVERFKAAVRADGLLRDH